MEFLAKGENNYLKAKAYVQDGRFKIAGYHLRSAEKKKLRHGEDFTSQGNDFSL